MPDPRHALVPIWRALPERRRWDIVHLLNRSARTCWCDLVDAALSDNEVDPCDSALPLGSESHECRTRCQWKDHGTEGHECACYCGKFGPTALDEEPQPRSFDRLLAEKLADPTFRASFDASVARRSRASTGRSAGTVLALFLVAVLVAAVALIAYRTGHDRGERPDA